MAKYIIRRVLLVIPTLISVSVVVFGVIHFIPGDPITMMFGQEPDPEAISRVRAYYNLDKPIHVQYLLWMRGVLTGNFGTSIRSGESVAKLVAQRFPATFFLLVAGLTVSLFIAVPLGILSAAKQNTGVDLGVSGLALLLLCIPDFWKGILFILCFAVWLRILPVGGYAALSFGLGPFVRHLVMPAMALGASMAGVTMRMLRSSILEVLWQEYIAVARAKGLSERVVFYRHALRNALIPAVTVIGMQVGYLTGGAIIIERVFSYPGMGMQLVSAVTARDYPLVQGQLLIFALLFLLTNVLTDVAYSLINPRVRFD